MESEFLNGKKIVEKHFVDANGKTVAAYEYLPGKLDTIPSRKGVKKAFGRKQFYKNDELIRSLTKLKDVDKVIVTEYTGVVQKVFPLELNVIYEDEHIAVVEKPSGLPTSGNKWKTLQNAIPKNLKKSGARDALACALTVHRLDAKTHGLVLVAKTASSRIKLGDMFANQKVEKTYIAYVQGRLSGKGTFNAQIEGKKALTHFEVLDHFDTVKSGLNSIVKLHPKTGRKHQIRIHLAQNGTPIIGDVKYGETGKTLKGKGLFLCALSLYFKHPVTGEELDLSIDLPNKFNRYKTRMEKWYQRTNSDQNNMNNQSL